jgi:hypothetical protein
LRDRLLARIAEMGGAPDHQRLAAEVLGVRNAPPELARRLVAQALVVEDRREVWARAGEQICAAAPAAPGVYVLRDERGRAVYVGKATNLRRRLRAHFAARRWRGLKAPFTRAVAAECHAVGSELEALLREAALIHDLQPAANVQVGEPNLETRAVPAALVKDVVVIVPSAAADSVELVGARADGGWLVQRTRRDGTQLRSHAARVLRFFRSPLDDRGRAVKLAPIVFSWLAGRGANATRLDPGDYASAREFRAKLAALLADEALFTERIVVLNS